MLGGFDSFSEAFYSIARCFADLGYEVIAFEGPGQGDTLKNTASLLLTGGKE